MQAPVVTASSRCAPASPLDLPERGSGLTIMFLPQNYAQDCLNTFNCQQQNVNIDSSSSIGIYMLSTVASQYMLSVNGQGIVPNSANRNGFAQTLTSWTRS